MSKEELEQVIEYRARVFMGDGLYSIIGSHIHGHVRPFMTGANEYRQDLGHFDDVNAAYAYITNHPKTIEAHKGFSPAASVRSAIASTPQFRD